MRSLTKGMIMVTIKKTDYIWTPAGTDIQERWKLLYGWQPPSELKEYQDKFKYYQELPMRKLDDLGKQEYEALLKKNKVVRFK
jgi:predicted transcriptional regulator YdeE